MRATIAPPMPTYSPSEPGPEIASSRPQNSTNDTVPPTTKNAAPRSSAMDSSDSALAAGCRSTLVIDDDSATRHPVRLCDRLGAVMLGHKNATPVHGCPW